MELAPAPVNFSEGVLVLQSPPSLPPGADDEQEPERLALVDLEDLHATASSAAAQAIAPKRTPNRNLRRRRCVRSCMVGCLKGLLLSSLWTLLDPCLTPGSRGNGKCPARQSVTCRGTYIIRAVDIVKILERSVNRRIEGSHSSTCGDYATEVTYFQRSYR